MFPLCFSYAAFRKKKQDQYRSQLIVSRVFILLKRFSLIRFKARDVSNMEDFLKHLSKGRQTLLNGEEKSRDKNSIFRMFA